MSKISKNIDSRQKYTKILTHVKNTWPLSLLDQRGEWVAAADVHSDIVAAGLVGVVTP